VDRLERRRTFFQRVRRPLSCPEGANDCTGFLAPSGQDFVRGRGTTAAFFREHIQTVILPSFLDYEYKSRDKVNKFMEECIEEGK